jgi:hypothetical protein
VIKKCQENARRPADMGGLAVGALAVHRGTRMVFLCAAEPVAWRTA